jgi:DNA-directed RNA polymerase subunit RPC12/RpoP
MATLQCTKCSRTMERDKIPLVCPFCGSKGTVKKTPSADQILWDVSSEENKFPKKE